MNSIIGIAGAFGSGKSLLGEILQELGFEKITLSQFLEEELTKKSKRKITRKKLQDLGNEWRKKYGNAVLVEKALDLAKENNWEKVVIEGFRNAEEVKRLRKEKNFLLVSLVVNRSIRYERLKDLKRREALTKELFDELDDRDLGIGEKEYGLHTAICVAMADVFIENNGSRENLARKVKEAVK